MACYSIAGGAASFCRVITQTLEHLCQFDNSGRSFHVKRCKTLFIFKEIKPLQALDS